MSTHRFGPDFVRIFLAGLLQEVSFVLMVHFPGYVQGLGATEALIGLLYAGGAIMALLFRPLLGRVLDLTHRRTVLLFCGISNVTVVALLSLTSHWGVLLWGLFLMQRVFQIALFTTMLTYMADSLPLEHRTQGLALFGMSGLIPIALGGVIGDLVIDGLGFGALFLLSAGAGLISWSIVWSLPVLPVMSTRPRRGFWSALAQRNLLPLWWITLCFSIGMETLFTFTRTYVDDRQIGSTGIFFGVYGVTAAAMRLIGGNRYDRVPHRPLAVVALISYGVGLGLLAVAGSVPILAPGRLLRGIGPWRSLPVAVESGGGQGPHRRERLGDGGLHLDLRHRPIGGCPLGRLPDRRVRLRSRVCGRCRGARHRIGCLRHLGSANGGGRGPRRRLS